MAYRTIIFFLLSIFFQNVSFGQYDSLSLLKKTQNDIDSIVNNAIQQRAFPGCVVYASLAGRPIFHKAYGYHRYDSINEVLAADIYDLASVTKVMAATLALMKLYDDGLLDLEKPIGDYIDGLGWSKLRKVTIREALGHQGGIKSWIKYYDEIQKSDGRYKRKTISIERSSEYPFQIATGKYLHKDFYNKIKKMIRKAEVQKHPEYVYSGLFFYLVPELVEELTGTAFETYLRTHFYDPLGMSTVSFSAGAYYSLDRVVPTEVDSFFRYEPIHGQVHDEGAILMKGISGNAGLFGSATDIARLWHMWLQDGTYNGVQYLHPATVDLFTSYQYGNKNNRRGLGFDKPLLQYDQAKSSVAKSTSPYSYGHSGYTGTLVWADRENQLLFIFLSNRVYPSRDQRALYQLNVRPSIHQLLYDYLSSAAGDSK
ncbi:serine hydrolase domain-containing protein [Marinoscillum furvescens]|uniref:CubicO group peptidase (Beta-lactamase class C family) n=1 Tax=Marinoscillum furvescens DSM 4134 TaxID=1122208 RepID=A0A3D9KZZ4_MARFU|nr:serine hydrolase [Marinoscillum furvescens]RED96220.1 CubicO group peptidase (beta-lactamase class C family) [Marinoscillum furvescens DSM 4134]